MIDSKIFEKPNKSVTYLLMVPHIDMILWGSFTFLNYWIIYRKYVMATNDKSVNFLYNSKK